MPKDKDYNPMDAEHFARAIIEGFHESDDRTTAIMGVALIDELIEEILRRHLSCDEASVKADGTCRKLGETFFGQSGLLSSFSSKIDICLALGIVGKKTYDNLHRLREVRNKFAHTLLMDKHKKGLFGVSFSSTKIVSYCNALSPFTGFPFAAKATPKEKFTVICVCAATSFFSYLRDYKHSAKGNPAASE
jgi:hypothetical protein